MRTSSVPFREAQSWHHCAVHAVNNLLQRRECSAQEFEDIAEELQQRTGGIRHKAPLGLGGYSADVVLMALKRRELEAVVLDLRKPEEALAQLRGETVVGALLNEVKHPAWWQFWRSGRHWLAALRRVRTRPGGQRDRSEWLVVDSQDEDSRPAEPLSDEAFLTYVAAALPGCVVFLVYG